METRSNRLLVLLVTGAIVVTLIVFAFWLIAAKNPDGPEYLIRFSENVTGVKEGSPVTYAGVAAGLVTAVQFDGEDPSIVLVKVRLNADIPIVDGVKAQISKSFIGTDSTVMLGGGHPGAPPIIATNGEQLPIIPATKGGLLGSGGDPVELIEKISRSVDKISASLDENGQQRTREQLEQLNTKAASWRKGATRLVDSLAGAGRGVTELNDSISGVSERAARMRATLSGRREAGSGINEKLIEAQRAAQEFSSELESYRPAVRGLESQSREVTERLRSVRSTTQRLGNRVERVDHQGIELFGSPKLPDFGPEKQPPPNGASTSGPQ